MASLPNAYLVVCRDDGFGEVHPLQAGARHTLGRAPNNAIVLKDDLCSREHAELSGIGDQWTVRDKGSLNGSRLNHELISQTEQPIHPHDQLQVGRSLFLFLLDLSELPTPYSLRQQSTEEEKLEIKQRLSKTRFLPPLKEKREKIAPTESGHTIPIESSPAVRTQPDEALAQLYRLAVAMGTAENPQQLAEIVLDGLLEAIPVDVGAILQVKKARELELVAYRHRNPAVHTYHKVSNFVSAEIVSSKEAVLAENVAADKHLANRESLAEMNVTGLICAPILDHDRVIGLVHLYSTQTGHTLTSEDLEFSLTVARQLGMAWHQVQRQESLSVENRELRTQLRLESELVGASPALREIESQISRVAATQATVLIRGESGSGKELVARGIHQSSPRRENPLICLNCAALTESLLESELFGHEKGAFTGATDRMIGKFEAADRGTLFLDEIGEMNLSTQAKLLRVLEGHPFERVGGNTPIKVDVRVVAATNRPLEEAVREGTFRRDLFFRLQVVEIWVPPLRDRKDDVSLLAEHFLKRFTRETGRKIGGFTPGAVKKLKEYHWPGNVRELRNVIERAVALSTGDQLDASDIWLTSPDFDLPDRAVAGVYEAISLAEIEKRHIEATLQHTDWNKSQAATILGIERSTLDRKIKTYDIQR